MDYPSGAWIISEPFLWIGDSGPEMKMVQCDQGSEAETIAMGSRIQNEDSSCGTRMDSYIKSQECPNYQLIAYNMCMNLDFLGILRK
jgi:hypothetical protein